MFVQDIIKNNARKRSSAQALIFEDGAYLTWADLHQRSGAIAAVLRRVGVSPGDRVTVLAKNCLEMIEIYIACCRLGAVFSPMNYRFAVPEFEYVLADSRPVAVLAQASYADEVQALRGSPAAEGVRAWISFGGDMPGCRTLETELDSPGDVPEDHPSHDDDPNFMCYTGGTTGKAKGVLLSHRNMMAAATNFLFCNRVREDSTYLVAGALFHIALAAPVAYWLAGGRTVVMNFDAVRALDLMVRERVTNLVATGTILKMLVEEQERQPRSVNLRNLDTGGAPVSPAMAARARSAFQVSVAQIYGQTEATLVATYLGPEEYEAGVVEGSGSAAYARLHSVGRAAPTNIVAVMDDHLRPVPPGTVGEIAVRGDNVMVGYWNKPDLTAATLRDGWLLTGDLGRMDEEGYLYLVDRKKDMIITGGENVYTSEVELVLGDHPDVSECVVVGVPDETWGERVHAIAVLREGATPRVEDLQIFCRGRLAGYKVPKTLEFRKELPKLPTGKIAKGALRDESRVGIPHGVHGN